MRRLPQKATGGVSRKLRGDVRDARCVQSQCRARMGLVNALGRREIQESRSMFFECQAHRGGLFSVPLAIDQHSDNFIAVPLRKTTTQNKSAELEPELRIFPAR